MGNEGERRSDETDYQHLLFTSYSFQWIKNNAGCENAVDRQGYPHRGFQQSNGFLENKLREILLKVVHMCGKNAVCVTAGIPGVMNYFINKLSTLLITCCELWRRAQLTRFLRTGVSCY